MCRMLVAPVGLLGRVVLPSFRAMARGKNPGREHKNSWDHPHGWGVVYEDRGLLRAYRSAQPCWQDPAFDAFGETRIFLLHARRATSGAVSAENAHPFSLDVAGRTWFFCHNGTVHDPLPASLGSGGAAATDSCRLFFRLAGEGLGTDTSGALQSVYGSLARYTSLNTFLLEEQELWTVCRWAKDAAYYTLYQSEAGGGLVVSSEPLPELAEGWTAMANGSVLRVDRRTGAAERATLLQP